MNRPQSRYQTALDLHKWEAELTDTEPVMPAAAFQWDALRMDDYDAAVEPRPVDEREPDVRPARGILVGLVLAGAFWLGVAWPFGSWVAAGAW